MQKLYGSIRVWISDEKTEETIITNEGDRFMMIQNLSDSVEGSLEIEKV
jgi:hypothetical protein